MLSKIEQIIEEKINPALNNHNGSCEAVDFKAGILYLRLYGSCSGCPGTQNTVKNGILPVLQRNIPEIQDIVISND